jgi:hypothetical protein
MGREKQASELINNFIYNKYFSMNDFHYSYRKGNLSIRINLVKVMAKGGLSFRNFGVLLMLVLFMGMSGCTPVPGPKEEESQASCERLNRLMYMIRQTDKAIQQRKEVKEIETMVSNCIALLKVQKLDTSGSCQYEDHEHYPQYARFILTDNLSSQLMRGRLPELFPYLIEFGSLFADDAEVSEYFGEKLALIAYHNPAIWVDYYNSHADVQDSMIRHTEWQILEKSRMLRRLESEAGSDGLIKVLEAGDYWKAK